MGRSGYVAALRERVGHRLLTLPSVTLCVLGAEGLLVVRHRDGGLWAPPGGAIEPGETPADAVVREGREEIGALATPTDLIGVFGGPDFAMTYDNGDEVTYVMSVFRCALDGTPVPDGDEVHDTRFVGQDEWPQLPVPGWMHIVAPHVFAWASSSSPAARFSPPSTGPGSL